MLSPRPWLAGFITWAVALFILSASSKPMPAGGPEIPHLDKIVHFGYFMGGAFAFATWILLRKGAAASLRLRILLPFVLFAFIGALDEYHQSFNPGRTGNDPFDWLADVMGSFTGILLANRLHPFLLAICTPPATPSENCV